MVTLLDGPRELAGHVLELARAPLFLRVVLAPDGKVDALDQPDDQVDGLERVFVYRRAGEPSSVHVGMIPRSRSFWIASAEYRHIDLPVNEAARLADTNIWRAWARARQEWETANQGQQGTLADGMGGRRGTA